MRNFFVSAFLLLVGIAVMTVCRMNNKQYLSELALVNVEALATGEGDVPTSCYGSGNVDCFMETIGRNRFSRPNICHNLRHRQSMILSLNKQN